MIDLVNVISVSVSEAPLGLGEYNVNNVALFTKDEPVEEWDEDWRAYVSPAAVGEDFGTDSEAYLQALAFFSQSPNVLNGNGQLIIFPCGADEELGEALTRVQDMVFFTGILSTFIPATDEDLLAFSTQVQATDSKIWMFPSHLTASIAGIFTDILDAGNYKTRCFLYTTSAQAARIAMAAYAGGGFSTNFDASNATRTQNLKQLITILPDEGITQTIYNNAKTAGVDLYISYAGIPSVVSNGNNKYFDQVYNLIWFVSQLKVSGFNSLRQVSTKVPQTEPGVTLLKDAYRNVCEAALNNAYVAPGAWNSAEFFGNQEDMIKNILERGYYIYSQPVNQQSQVDRLARKAPLIQIAIKEAGAIQQSSVIVNVNP